MSLTPINIVYRKMANMYIHYTVNFFMFQIYRSQSWNAKSVIAKKITRIVE